MKKHLREDKTCLNCGYAVDKIFCSNCGQENTEVRHSFAELAGEFFRDLTHYEGRFWKSIKLLLSRPGFLTIEYLAGKRKSFVAPVRLYIFISLFTFLLPFLLPDTSEEPPVVHPTAFNPADTVSEFAFITGEGLVLKSKFKSAASLDSFQAVAPEAQRLSWFDYKWNKKAIELRKYDSYELYEKFITSLFHNFPKALFIYMPLFAFVFWIFHNRKRWMYFDHAIFTLHYFSFMLLAYTLFELTAYFLSFPFTEETTSIAAGMLALLLILWYIIYLFLAHRRVYGQKVFISLVKTLAIYLLNLSLFLVLLIALGGVTIILLH